MTDDPDIDRVARRLIHHRGEEAATYTAGQADELLEAGEHEGAVALRHKSAFWGDLAPNRARNLAGEKHGAAAGKPVAAHT